MKQQDLFSINWDKLKNSNLPETQAHGFHIVEPSPWPLFTATAITQLIYVILFWLHNFKQSPYWILWSIIFLFLVIFMWFRDIIVESTFQGRHTNIVQKLMRTGFILVLISEAMFFFGFFWCFLYMSLAPSIWIGGVWPPLAITPVNPWGIPFINTLLLLSSGLAGTYAHKLIRHRDTRDEVIFGLSLSIFYGVLFTLLQFWEYTNTSFSINDGIYGSIFFVSTGFHGLHVIVGTIALIVCLYRHYNYHFQIDHHTGLELSLWYWHFVDVIWILLYIIIYVWGYRYI